MPDWLWKLQARYGSTTASFFNFLRFMILLNFVNFIFILGLIMVPQLVPNRNEQNFNISSENYTLNDQTAPFYEMNENHSELCNAYYWDMYDAQRNATLTESDTLDNMKNFFLLLLQGDFFPNSFTIISTLMSVRQFIWCRGPIPSYQTSNSCCFITKCHQQKSIFLS